MVQVLEQVNLHLHVLQIGGAQVLQADLLDGHRLSRAPVQGPIHAAKSPLSQAVAQLVVLETGHILGCPLCRSFSARPLLSFARLAIAARGSRGLLCVAGCAGL
jgi:hypothetical protein